MTKSALITLSLLLCTSVFSLENAPGNITEAGYTVTLIYQETSPDNFTLAILPQAGKSAICINLQGSAIPVQKLYLYDMEGELVLERDVNQKETVVLEMNRFSGSTFFIRLFDQEDKLFSTHQIDKLG